VRRLTIAVVAAVVGLFAVSLLKPADAVNGDVSYALAWNLEGATVDADGSWSVITDLGYTVTITGGHLITFSATLVACPHTHGILDRIFGIVSPAVAWAGHSSADDPALVGGPIVQSLVDHDSVELGTTTVHESSYCEGHTNWGGGGLVADSTLELVGTWQAPGDTEPRPLVVSSRLNWGTKASLERDQISAVYAEIGPDPVSIQIVRDLVTAFDGIEFVTADEESIATSFLRSLAGTTHFEVTGGTIHTS
jgi:hypothetical protein